MLEKLQTSRIALAESICPAVAADLRIALQRLARHNARIKQAVELGRYRRTALGAGLVPGERLWLTLLSLADQAG